MNELIAQLSIFFAYPRRAVSKGASEVFGEDECQTPWVQR